LILASKTWQKNFIITCFLLILFSLNLFIHLIYFNFIVKERQYLIKNTTECRKLIIRNAYKIRILV